jgi:hypothetical protein
MKTEVKAELWGRNVLVSFSTTIFLLFVSGCFIHKAHFRPGGSDPYARAEEASAYQQLDLDGTTIGYARIWSRGILKHPEKPGLAMHIGMRIKNDTPEEILLDLENTELQAHLNVNEGQTVTFKNVIEMMGSDRIPPGTRTRIELLYMLPEEFNSNEVKLFEFNWAVKRNDRRLSLSTPFYRDPQRSRVYVASSYNPWYPLWASYPFLFYPSWSFWHGYYYNPSYLWRWNYPRYWRYPNHRYYKRNHHLIPRRPAHKRSNHRYTPRRHRTR